MILPSPEIWHRDDFPILANWRKLWTVVEVGVDRGEFSNTFLRKWQGDRYLGVDHYLSYSEVPWDREADFQAAVIRYERYAKVANIVRMESGEAARRIGAGGVSGCHKGKVDFVYIDGAHDATSAAADLSTWWPLVSNKGILAGHDFDEDHPGVVGAVTAFAKKNGLTIYLTTDDKPPSWYTYKSGMPGPNWVRNKPEE